MAHEVTTSPLKALQSYAAAIPLVTLAQSELATSPTTPANTNAIFTQYHELWVWTERILWRAATLTSSIYPINHPQPIPPPQGSGSSIGTSSIPLWTWLNHYLSLSQFWPANFMSMHRETVCMIFLRGVIVGAPIPTTTDSTPSAPSSLGPSYSKRNSILSTASGKHRRSMSVSRSAASGNVPIPVAALTLINQLKSFLTLTTSFPKAGERNERVEEFVEVAMGVWVALCGDYTSGNGEMNSKWIMDVSTFCLLPALSWR